jgi:hypothetical protein
VLKAVSRSFASPALTPNVYPEGAPIDHRRQQVERITRAFHGGQEDALDWDNAPELVKEKIRQCARDAIALLEQRREQIPTQHKADPGAAPPSSFHETGQGFT